MVLLTMTPAVVEAVKLYTKSEDYRVHDEEPSLESAAVGNPISHGQLIRISKYLKAHHEEEEVAGSEVSVHLSDLLRGCGLYVAPPPPKPVQSEEYKALMAKLRAEEEHRQYQQMLDPSPPSETFHQRFPTASYGHLFPPQPSASTPEEDEITYADINRQMTMIANVLISIIACSVCVWKAAWHWDVPARLALSMGSSILVAVAEVAIYAGYIGRLTEARSEERKRVEKKEIADSWIIEANVSGKSKKIGAIADEVLVPGLRQRLTKKGA